MPQATSEFGQRFARGDAHAPIVEIGALALLGDEHVVGRRIIDDAGDELALALEPDRDGENRNAVQEVGGPVERIDMPGVGLVAALDRAAFLHEKAVARTGARQFLEHDLFGAPVGGGDEIAGALDGHLQIFDLAEVALQAAPGLYGGGSHDVHQCGSDHGVLGKSRGMGAGGLQMTGRRRARQGVHLRRKVRTGGMPYAYSRFGKDSWTDCGHSAVSRRGFVQTLQASRRRDETEPSRAADREPSETRRRDGRDVRPTRATPRERERPPAGQLLRVGLLLAIAALCAGALKAASDARSPAATARPSPQTSSGAVRA